MIKTITFCFFEVRRFISVPNDKLKAALDYNLDPRRLNSGLDDQLHLFTHLRDFDVNSHTVLVVKVITSKPYDDTFIPERSSEYYIEYICKFREL